MEGRGEGGIRVGITRTEDNGKTKEGPPVWEEGYCKDTHTCFTKRLLCTIRMNSAGKLEMYT